MTIHVVKNGQIIARGELGSELPPKLAQALQVKFDYNQHGQAFRRFREEFEPLLQTLHEQVSGNKMHLQSVASFRDYMDLGASDALQPMLKEALEGARMTYVTDAAGKVEGIAWASALNTGQYNALTTTLKQWLDEPSKQVFRDKVAAAQLKPAPVAAPGASITLEQRLELSQGPVADGGRER